jgi:molybdopterin converting factor small subunit
VAEVVLPNLRATEAGGRKRFEARGETVADALRALPVANLLFDERGALRPLVNVYFEGVDMRETAGLETAIARKREVRVVAVVAGG